MGHLTMQASTIVASSADDTSLRRLKRTTMTVRVVTARVPSAHLARTHLPHCDRDLVCGWNRLV